MRSIFCRCQHGGRQPYNETRGSPAVSTDETYKENVRHILYAEKVEHAIRELTDIPSWNGKITNKPIYMRVTSPDGHVLTLTDFLLGITAIRSNQENVEQATVELTREFISRWRTTSSARRLLE
jgi:hypothetical protein